MLLKDKGATEGSPLVIVTALRLRGDRQFVALPLVQHRLGAVGVSPNGAGED